MREETWRQIDAQHAGFEQAVRAQGEPVTEAEIARAEAEIGLPFPSDYREFLQRLGAAVVGAERIYGLRPVQMLGAPWSVVEVNLELRAAEWPAIDCVLVFSEDGGGNPVGVAPDGRVWKSDHDAAYVYDWQADSFEEFLQHHCLEEAPSEYEGLSGAFQRVAREQAALLARVGVSGVVASTAYDNIWIVGGWDVLDEPRLELIALEPEDEGGPPIQLWHAAPRAMPGSGPDDHYIGLQSLWRKRPTVASVLALPVGYRVWISGEQVEAIFDPTGRKLA